MPTPVPSRSPRESSPVAHPRIVSLSIDGSGFLGGVQCTFADGLNCIIGGSGVGKTTLLEVLAHATAPAGAPPSEQLRAALGDAIYQVGIELAHGGRFRIEGSVTTTPRVLDADGAPTDAVASQLMTVDHFRVHEVERIGHDAESQLRLLDGFAASEMQEIGRQIDGVMRELGQSAASLTQIENDEAERHDDARELATLAAHVRALDATASQTVSLQAAHDASGLRVREALALDNGVVALREARSEGATLAGTLAQRFDELVDGSLAASANHEVLDAAAHTLTTARDACAHALRDLARACEIAEGALRDHRAHLARRHDEQEKAYAALLNDAKEAAGRADERRAIHRKYAAALDAQKKLDLLRGRRCDEETKRHALVERLEELRNHRFARRRAIAHEITTRLAPHVKCTVRQSEGKIAYQDLLCDSLKRSGLHYKVPAEKIAETVTPDELVRLVRAGDVAGLAERAHLGEDQAAKVVAKLREPGVCFRIETVDLPDGARIDVAVGGTFKPSDKVSTGQRCAAIFMVMLLESARPLLIDQPDDSINGEYLAMALDAVRAHKSSRQMIFVTHNANVPVLCESERVTALEADNARGRIAHAGTVDETRDEIQSKLEGGVEAFKERMRRYGY